MLLEVILAIALGTACGIFTGLTPGIHINLVAATLVSLGPFLIKHVNPVAIGVFVITMSVVHSYLDIIPSTFLGAPDESNIAIALPAHRLLLQGKAYDAVCLTIFGSMSALLLGVITAPLFYLFIIFVYPFLEKYMFWIIAIPVFYVMLRDKRRLANIAFFILSGTCGLLAFNIPIIKDPMFPLLTGLFGMSILIPSILDKIKIPEQKIEITIKVKTSEKIKAVIGGFIAGTLTSFLPGLGSSQGALIAQSFFKKMSEHGFMILVGGIGTINFVMSIAAYYALEKARNGSILAISTFIPKFSLFEVTLFLVVTLVAGGISTYLSLIFTKKFSKIIQKVSYTKLTIGIIILILLMTFLLSNIYGFILLCTCTALGLITTKQKVAKTNLLGCLLVPVLIYFWPF